MGARRSGPSLKKALALTVSSLSIGALAQDPSATGLPTLDGGEGGSDLYKLDTSDNIKKASAQLAWDLMTYYRGNLTGQVPGILPMPPNGGHEWGYYWWEAGAMWGTLIDYWRVTGDDTYLDVTSNSLTFQSGDLHDYNPANWSKSMGNDDMGFWAMSAMNAAESKFPNPKDKKYDWLAMTETVWNNWYWFEQSDKKECGGGIRWQHTSFTEGWDYKNTIANGIYFNLGARLYKYTGNETYLKGAEELWKWMWDLEYIDHDSYAVWDGGHVEKKCKDVDKTQWSYNGAILAQGVAYLYAITKDEKWKPILDGIIDNMIKTFFPKGIAYEQRCEPTAGQCNIDQLTFKGYVHRWLAIIAAVVPETAAKISPVLESSATAAVNQCTGGKSGRQCGFYWSKGKYVDVASTKSTGAGEQMDVLAAALSLLIKDDKAPVTAKTGGDAKGTEKGGGEPNTDIYSRKLTTGDKAGAGIVTAVVLAMGLGLFAFLVV